MDAPILAQVLRGLPPIVDPNVLVGTATADDAGVYRLSDELALVQTVDFFTPIVDDPYQYGAIAAANALSDIYAMGARPLCALAIAAFPVDLGTTVITSILRGGIDKAAEAGIAILGGHTVKDTEPKYGLSVTGIVHPDRIWRNSTARPGDLLLLTKPIGTGILTTARRSDAIDAQSLQPAIDSMATLNKAAAQALEGFQPHAVTDVTGFGLLGHLCEMLGGAGVGATLHAPGVPSLPLALDLAAEWAPGGSRANLQAALEKGVTFAEEIDPSLRLLLCDAQTSGGLLVALAPHEAAAYERALHATGATCARIGEIDARLGLRIVA